jgi:hypothetical protein
MKSTSLFAVSPFYRELISFKTIQDFNDYFDTQFDMAVIEQSLNSENQSNDSRDKLINRYSKNNSNGIYCKYQTN